MNAVSDTGSPRPTVIARDLWFCRAWDGLENPQILGGSGRSPKVS